VSTLVFFSRVGVILLLIQIFWVETYRAQAPDTVSLRDVDIVSKKETVTQTGKRSETLDSTLMVPYSMYSLSELISAGTGIFVKSYGPGAIGSTALRGGNASQTAFVWNGFNLQNTMLGQTDMSLLPTGLFDEVQVDYGASAASWGSGAVAGAIQLKNNQTTSKDLHIRATIGLGSFNRRFINGQITFGNSRLSSVTRFYTNLSSNNFPYTDSTDVQSQQKTMEHASYLMGGVMQQVRWLVTKRSVINFNGWYNAANRKLPAFTNNQQSKTTQADQALRFTADYKFGKNKYSSVIKAAFFDETLKYEDSIAMIFTHNKVKTVMAEVENYYRWNGKHESAVFVLTNHSFGNTEFYEKQQQYSRTGLVLNHKLKLFKQRLTILGVGRAEYFSAGTLPLTWNIGLNYKLTGNFRLLLNGGSFYRQPTLNELYWIPGGNPQLKPEKGQAIEGSVEYNKKLNNVEFAFGGSLFARNVENWILWVPGPGANPQAKNVQEVFSRGTDSKASVFYKQDKFVAGIVANTSYVLSTVKETSLPHDASLERQLIYTPRYIVTARLHLAYGRISFLSSYQYCGYRFTSSDNSQWLIPYATISARASYHVTVYDGSFDFFAAVYNAADQPYSVMAGRPMPGRNYEAGVTIKFYKPKNK